MMTVVPLWIVSGGSWGMGEISVSGMMSGWAVPNLKLAILEFMK